MVKPDIQLRARRALSLFKELGNQNQFWKLNALLGLHSSLFPLIIISRFGVSICISSVELRARTALSLFKEVPLRTRKALSPLTLYSDSALLVLNGTSLNIDSALLALN